MDNRRINERYCEIMMDLIDTEEELNYIKEGDVTIICLSSDSEKKNGRDKLVFGQCEKISDKYKWSVPCDFTITIFEPNIIGFTEEQLRILIFHELLHVGIDGDALYCRKHDYEDFECIIRRYGIDWNKVD